jgi:ribosome recycling factor
MTDEIIMDAEERMEKSISALKNELSHIRTGKATPALLDGITVDYYGVATPINQVANVSVPEPRLLTIQPWDKKMLKEIERAIQKSELGINPNNDGTVIRLPMPELTKETREEYAKQAHKKGEEGKVNIRNIRRNANDAIKKLEKNKEITEDEASNAADDIQKLTDKMIAEMEKVTKAKEADIRNL